MKRVVVLASLCVVVLAGSSSSEGAIRKWSFEGSVHGGSMDIDDDAEREAGGTSSFRVGFAVFPAFSVEATFDAVSSESRDEGSEGADYTEEYAGLRLIGTLRSAEDVRAMPYVFAGGGRIEAELDPGGSSSPLTDEAGYEEVGAGVRYFAWRTFNVRFEVAYRHTRVLEVTESNIIYSLGLSVLLFGAK